MRRLFLFVVALLAIGCSSHSSVPAPGRISPDIFQSRDPGGGWFQTKIPEINGQVALPVGITVDESNHIWVADLAGGISEIGMDQVVTTFALSIKPRHITLGSDLNLWVTSGASDGLVARVTPQGIETDLAVAPSFTLGNIINGPDGALWFPECSADKTSGGIGTISTSGAYTFYASSCQEVIANGSDGNIWFGDNGANISNMSTQGQLIGIYDVGDASFFAMTGGSDGALYAIASVSAGPDELVRVATNGTVTHIGPDRHTTHFGPERGFRGITNGPNGNLFLSTFNKKEYIARFNTTTQKYSQQHFNDGHALGEIVVGPDGNFWIPSGDGQHVYTYVRLAMTLSPTNLSIPVGQSANLNVKEVQYFGQWTAISGNPLIATVSPNSQSGALVVTGVAPGTTTITVSDTTFNSIAAKVTVTP